MGGGSRGRGDGETKGSIMGGEAAAKAQRRAVQCCAVLCLCCAGGEAEGGLGLVERGTGRRRSAPSQGLVGHGGMGTGDMGLLWSGEERTTDRPSAPAEAVYAVHDALPNLLWGRLALHVPCTEPRHPPAVSPWCANYPRTCQKCLDEMMRCERQSKRKPSQAGSP